MSGKQSTGASAKTTEVRQENLSRVSKGAGIFLPKKDVRKEFQAGSDFAGKGMSQLARRKITRLASELEHRV